MTDLATTSSNGDQAPTGDANLDSKAASLFERFSADQRKASAEEPDPDAADDTPTNPQSPQAKKAAEPPAAAPDPKLARLLEQERVIRQREAAAAKRERELEERGKGTDEKLTKLEQLSKVWEKADEDPEKILELLEQKVGPEKVVEWFGKMGDPAYRAKLEAKRLLDANKPDMSPLEKRLEALEARNRELEFKGVKEKVQGEISGLVTGNAAEVPFSHRLLSKKPEKFWSRVESKARTLSAPEKEGGQGLVFGQDYNMSDVIMQIEADLKDDYDSLAAEQAAASAGNTPKVSESPAAGKASTSLSNRDASVRTTLDHNPPKEDMNGKIARLIRQARREST